LRRGDRADPDATRARSPRVRSLEKKSFVDKKETRVFQLHIRVCELLLRSA